LAILQENAPYDGDSVLAQIFTVIGNNLLNYYPVSSAMIDMDYIMDIIHQSSVKMLLIKKDGAKLKPKNKAQLRRAAMEARIRALIRARNRNRDDSGDEDSSDQEQKELMQTISIDMPTFKRIS
jgi:hypothetical protein